MREKILILLLLVSSIGKSQELRIFTKPISAEDSVTIQTFKSKMSQHINANPDSAFYFSRKIKELSIKKEYGTGICDADYLIGQCFKRIQEIDSAIYYFNNTLTYSQKISYPQGVARAYNSLCRTYYLTGDMDSSIEACQMAIEISRQMDDPTYLILADSYTALATAYVRQNYLEDAIKALLVVDSIHNAAPLRPDVIAAAYQNLGNIYLELKDYNTSENYFIKANDEFIKLGGGAAYYLNTTHINLSQVYFYKNDLKKADSLLSLSYSFFSTIKDERTVAVISTYLGKLKVKENQFEEAEKYFKEGFEIHKRNQRTYEASLNALELANLSIKNGQPNLAIEYLKQAETFNKVTINTQIAQEINELFSKSYAASNNYRKAYEYKEKATAIKDSLQEIQSSEKIKEIEAIYQTERRDREITLLTSKNELVQQQKTSQRKMFIGGLILTTVVGLFFFLQYRNRQKTNHKLQELDKAKSTFFANISHEFRTPLTLIRGPIEDQLLISNLSQADRKNLQLAKANTQRLESLVEQLLALSKLESGNLKLQLQPGDLIQFINAQIDVFTFSAKEKQIQLEFLKDNTNKIVWFDRDALGKIVFNLLGNAIKYTPEKGIITVKASLENDVFYLKVSNTGSYLTLEQQQKVFTRFYQTNALNSGTGIGLALTKELVELHKGFIAVSSKEDGFTIFEIKIPVDKKTYKPSEILSETLQEKHPEAFYQEPLIEDTILQPQDAPVVLIVEDNEELRNYIRSIFDGEFEIHTAKNGKEGLEKAMKYIPDVIISDIMMPVEDGFSLTKNLKENELTSHIPILLLTAKSEDVDKLKGIEIGADAYITKPFNSKILKATLNNLIENRRKLQMRFSQEIILKPKDISISSADEKFLKRLQDVLDEKLTQHEFSTSQFFEEMGVSRMQLHRKLKALTGQSTSEFLRSQRLKAAIQLINQEKISISEVGYAVGFNDPSYFTKCFKQEYGVSPSDYIKK